jgi:hypothetical protein
LPRSVRFGTAEVCLGPVNVFVRLWCEEEDLVGADSNFVAYIAVSLVAEVKEISLAINLVVLPDPDIAVAFQRVVEVRQLRKFGKKGAWTSCQRIEKHVV